MEHGCCYLPESLLFYMLTEGTEGSFFGVLRYWISQTPLPMNKAPRIVFSSMLKCSQKLEKPCLRFAKHSLIELLLQGDDVPQQALYTDTWRFVIPEVYIRCPGCPMALNATVTSAPVTSFDSSEGIQTEGIPCKTSFPASKPASWISQAFCLHQSVEAILEGSKSWQDSYGNCRSA